jgi:hypothetical protein
MRAHDQNSKSELDVRFGSKADIAAHSSDVRFTPKSRHWGATALGGFRIIEAFKKPLKSLSAVGLFAALSLLEALNAKRSHTEDKWRRSS